jgi:hypothetical protein
VSPDAASAIATPIRLPVVLSAAPVPAVPTTGLPVEFQYTASPAVNESDVFGTSNTPSVAKVFSPVWFGSVGFTTSGMLPRLTTSPGYRVVVDGSGMLAAG